MTKVKRSMMTTCTLALLLGTMAGLAVVTPAVAQPADEPGSEDPPQPAEAQPADEPTPEEQQPSSHQPADEATSENLPPAATSAQPSTTPATAQPLPGPSAVASPPPAFAPPSPYHPIARRPTPMEPAEVEGPITSWTPLRFAVAFESRTSWLLDDGAKRVVGEDRATASGLSLQADVLRFRDRVALRLDLAWVKMSRSASSSDYRLWEKLNSNLVSLGISLRYELLRWLAPYASVAGGLGWDKLTVADLHDRQRFGHGSVGAGLFLRSPGLHLWRGTRTPALGLVGRVEGGYALASGSDFVLQADARSSSEKPIPTSDVPLGHVARNVPYLRVSLGLAF